MTALIETGTRAEIAHGYAGEIAERPGQLMHGPPWSDWNRSIIARFGISGLDSIKREAWRIVDERER